MNGTAFRSTSATGQVGRLLQFTTQSMRYKWNPTEEHCQYTEKHNARRKRMKEGTTAVHKTLLCVCNDDNDDDGYYNDYTQRTIEKCTPYTSSVTKKKTAHTTHTFCWTKIQHKKHVPLINLMRRTFNDGLRSFYYTLCTIPSITIAKKSNLIVQTPPLTVNHNPNTHGHFNYFSYSLLFVWCEKETRARQCVYMHRKRCLRGGERETNTFVQEIRQLERDAVMAGFAQSEFMCSTLNAATRNALLSENCVAALWRGTSYPSV